MKKQIIYRGLLGLPLGIAVGFIIALVISMCINDGRFYPVQPELMERMGSELNAVIFQTVSCGVLGAGFAMASVIWQIDSWSLVKQSGAYFAVACAIMFPIAYFSNWMGNSIGGIFSYIGIFVLIFVLIWITQYLLWKNRIKKINAGIRDAVPKNK